MSVKNMRAVILWTKDKKVGVEKIGNVPDSQRFVGAVTPVKFSGDKKFYPAKVLFISDNLEAVEAKVKEVEAEIVKSLAQSLSLPAAGSKRNRSKKKSTGNVASEQDVAIALGGRPPVPKHLKETHESHQKSKKEIKNHKLKGQLDLDQCVMRTLFPNSESSKANAVSGAALMDSGEGDESEQDEDDSKKSGSDSDRSESDSESEPKFDAEGLPTKKRRSSSPKSCSCHACSVLQKYANPVYSNFLLDVVKLIDSTHATTNSDCEKKFLKLKEISSNIKQVELVAGKGIFIPLTEKEQLKVDFRNKPSSLVRETLYGLFGKECFQQLTVTGFGTKPGTYTIAPDVLQTVCTFVNRNVRSDQTLKQTKIVSMINKRAPEWRKGKAAKTAPKEKLSSEAICTSPFRCTPIKAPVNESPVKRTPVKKTPSTPSKSPAKETVGMAPSPPKVPTPVVQQSTVGDKGCGYQPNGQFYQPSHQIPAQNHYDNFYRLPQPSHDYNGYYGNGQHGQYGQYGYYGSQQPWGQTNSASGSNCASSDASGPSYVGL